VDLAPIPRVRPTTWTIEVDAGGGHAAVRRRAPLTVREAIATQ
jgi:hypothetical protein